MKFRITMMTLVVGCVMNGRVMAQLVYDNSLSVSLGAYAANGFGTNAYYGARYNYFIYGGKVFVEGGLGWGSLSSNVLESVTKSQIYDTERLFAYEFVGGYDMNPNGYVPYVVFGVAGLNYGGQSSFAGVLGLGKRVPLKGVFGGDRFGFRYDVRDQIFSQTIYNNEPFISHNIAFTVGLQFYF